MGWRVQLATDPVTDSDVSYGTGRIALLSNLEVWLGIIIACLPNFTPLFTKYGTVLSDKLGSTPRRGIEEATPKEASQTIGGGKTRAYGRKKFGRLDSDSLLELEEGLHPSLAASLLETTLSTPARVIHASNDKHLRDLRNIEVRHEVQVMSRLQRPKY